MVRRPRPIRLAHLVSHPIQYFAPLYRELAARSELELTVYVYSAATASRYFDAQFNRWIAWDGDLTQGYPLRVTRSAARHEAGSGGANMDLISELVRRRFDAVWAHGYAHVNVWLAAAATFPRGTTFLIREEQTLLHGRPLHKRVLKKLILRRVPGTFCLDSNV